jgi:4-diphosphocytidyl-2-C-methyl-D-erythritol kinase
MFISGACDIKLNLTLRVLNRRRDGYHNICSLFWRLRSPEVLEVDFSAGSDYLTVTGADISGENILTRTCRHIRDVYGAGSLPPIGIRLHKHLPAGGGVGAGSGNAAALLRLVKSAYGFGGGEMAGVASLGADVAFLASAHSLAIACGVGEVLRGVAGALPLSAVIFFPCWSSNTPHAYRSLDLARASGHSSPVTEDAAVGEAESLLGALASGSIVGEIPNDFMCCAGHEDKYSALESMACSTGSLAWGLCGSGSSYFALYRPHDAAGGVRRMFEAIRHNSEKFKWLQQILFLE